MTGALRRECAPRGKPQAASGRWQPSCILPLRVARKHFDHIVVQAVVELALEGPRELLIFDFSRPQQELVGVHLDARRPEADFHFDAVRRLVRVKGEERMFVPRQLDLYFFEKLAQDHIADIAAPRIHAVSAGASTRSPRSFISPRTFSKVASALASKSTK